MVVALLLITAGIGSLACCLRGKAEIEERRRLEVRLRHEGDVSRADEPTADCAQTHRDKQQRKNRGRRYSMKRASPDEHRGNRSRKRFRKS